MGFGVFFINDYVIQEGEVMVKLSPLPSGAKGSVNPTPN